MSAKKPAAPRTRRAPWIAFGLSAAALATFAIAYIAVGFIPDRDRGNVSVIWGLSILVMIGTALVGASRLPTSNPKWPAIMCIANVPILMLFFGVLSLIKQMG